MTGRLGIFRINKDGSSLPDPGDVTIVHTQRRVDVYWDTIALRKKYGKSGETKVWRYCEYISPKASKSNKWLLDVFYLPVRIMHADPYTYDYERPMLTGLLLLPTGKKNGQFRRVGVYELSEFSVENGIAPLINTTQQINPTYFVSRGKNYKYTIEII
jgi:hypothetical protein